MPALTERLEHWRALARWDLPESEIDAQMRAARAEYDRISEKIESRTPRHC